MDDVLESGDNKIWEYTIDLSGRQEGSIIDYCQILLNDKAGNNDAWVNATDYIIDRTAPTFVESIPEDETNHDILETLILSMADSASGLDEENTIITATLDGNEFLGFTRDNNVDNQITVTISNPVNGQYIFNIIPKDIIGNTGESINITLNDINVAPVFDSLENKIINENELLEFSISATDPDEDDIIYSAINLPEGASFNSETKTFSWTPTYEQSGSYDVTFTVSDGTLEISEIINIIVNDINNAPIINFYFPNENPTITEEELKLFSIVAYDINSDILTYTWYLDDVEVETEDNNYTYYADYNSAGTYNVAVVCF